MNRINCKLVLLTSILLSSVVLAEDPAPVAKGKQLPSIQNAASDALGRITVNGKPFFPILMYDVPTDPVTLKMLREHGFNTLSGSPEVADTLLANGFYTAVHAGTEQITNLDGVLFGVGMDSPALYWKQDLLEKTKADLVRMRALVPNRPIMNAIGYWEDEPAGVYSNKVPAKERYEDLVSVLDVCAPYLYPLPYQPVRSVGEAVERANAATGGKKPLLPILQLFTWEAKDRYPTPAELKCMVYLSLIHGADGIGYYSYNYVSGKKDTNVAKEQPALWAAVKQINAEVAKISGYLPLMANNSSVKLKEGSSGVEFRALGIVTMIGSLLISQMILVANTANTPNAVTLELDGDVKGKLKRLDGGKDIALEKGIAKITLAPNEAVGLTY